MSDKLILTTSGEYEVIPRIGENNRSLLASPGIEKWAADYLYLLQVFIAYFDSI